MVLTFRSWCKRVGYHSKVHVHENEHENRNENYLICRSVLSLTSLIYMCMTTKIGLTKRTNNLAEPEEFFLVDTICFV